MKFPDGPYITFMQIQSIPRLFTVLILAAFYSSVPGELIFRTGFEAQTTEILESTPPRIDRLQGRDESVPSPNHWEEDLQAEGRDLWFNYVDHSDGKNPGILGARLSTDPENPENRVFHAWQKDAEWQDGGFWSRVQGELHGFEWEEIYYQVRFRLDDAIALGDGESEEDLDLSLFEVGGNPGFHLCRIMLHKWGSKRDWSNGKSELKWRAEVRTPEQNHTFFKSSGVRPRYNTWQKLEFYARAGDSTSGRYWVAIDDEVLFDETVATKDSGIWENAGILKVYCGNLTRFLNARDEMVNVWFDDMEIWNSFPEAASSIQILRPENKPHLYTIGKSGKLQIRANGQLYKFGQNYRINLYKK